MRAASRRRASSSNCQRFRASPPPGASPRASTGPPVVESALHGCTPHPSGRLPLRRPALPVGGGARGERLLPLPPLPALDGRTGPRLGLLSRRVLCLRRGGPDGLPLLGPRPARLLRALRHAGRLPREPGCPDRRREPREPRSPRGGSAPPSPLDPKPDRLVRHGGRASPLRRRRSGAATGLSPRAFPEEDDAASHTVPFPHVPLLRAPELAGVVGLLLRQHLRARPHPRVDRKSVVEGQ